MIVRAETPEDRAAIVAYIAHKLNMDPHNLVGDMPYEALASMSSQNGVLGAVIYMNLRSAQIELTAAGEPGWLSKSRLKFIFGYPFDQLGVRRLTAFVHRKNKRSRKLVEGLGFKLEGVCKHYYKNGDACLYGMIKRECRWI